MGIFDELEEDYKQRDAIYGNIEALRGDLKALTEKYDKEIENRQREFDKISELIERELMLISELATFDSNSISMVITDILNSLTDKKYVCLNKTVPIFFKCDKSVNMIVEDGNSDFNIEGFYASYSELSTSLPNVILMGFKDEKISFRDRASYGEVFRTSESNEIVEIINDFINIVIEYRYENGLDEMTSEQLQQISNEYIVKNKAKQKFIAKYFLNVI